nr:DUF6628 family protein [Sphingomonas gellani]
MPQPALPPALQAHAAMLPHLLPMCANARIALFAIRRMGAHGLADANAAHAMFAAFGLHFRRPLVLMRALMAEIAGNAVSTVSIAPCCCPRMTAAESTLLDVLAAAETRPDQARLLLEDLLAVRQADGLLATAAAVAASFADGGRPIS